MEKLRMKEEQGKMTPMEKAGVERNIARKMGVEAEI